MTKNVRMSGKVLEPKDNWETTIIKNWKVDGSHCLHMEINPRSNVRWDYPPWYKINFDGASKGNPGIVGCKIIIRDENGYSNGAMVIPIGNESNHIAKASATLYGILFAKSKNIEKI